MLRSDARKSGDFLNAKLSAVIIPPQIIDGTRIQVSGGFRHIREFFNQGADRLDAGAQQLFPQTRFILRNSRQERKKFRQEIEPSIRLTVEEEITVREAECKHPRPRLQAHRADAGNFVRNARHNQKQLP